MSVKKRGARHTLSFFHSQKLATICDSDWWKVLQIVFRSVIVLQMLAIVKGNTTMTAVFLVADVHAVVEIAIIWID